MLSLTARVESGTINASGLPIAQKGEPERHEPVEPTDVSWLIQEFAGKICRHALQSKKSHPSFV